MLNLDAKRRKSVGETINYFITFNSQLKAFSGIPVHSTNIREQINIDDMPNTRKPRPKRRKNDAQRDNSRNLNERNFKRDLAEKSSIFSDQTGSHVRNKREVEKLLAGIGTPEPAPIVPDPFQLEALEAIETQDVLVTAPTGSGKTWIAREEIRRLLNEGKRAWYTTPLKALTNSKYLEFSNEFGAETVGILTGDRKENTNAPLIVGTTEIYRNQLFDSLRTGEQVGTDFVILDEAHYLSDEERGHVWEEAIILSPPRIRLLLLSATIGNAEEFAEWIEEVRGVKVRVINRAGSRPVPLRAAFLAPDLRLLPLFDEQEQFNREIEQFTKRRGNGERSFRRQRR